MKILHFLFWYLTTLGVSSSDEDLQHQSEVFVKRRLIPILRENKIRGVDFKNVKLCLCSGEIGCVARTTGWIANIDEELTTEEKELYKNTCFTDGKCYQNSHSSALTDYGCIDSSREDSDVDIHFHDNTVKVCQNTTIGKGNSAWVCCQDSHFCANTTELVANHAVKEFVKTSAVFLMFIIFVFVAVIVALVVNSQKTIKKFFNEWRTNKIDGKYDQEQLEIGNMRSLEASDQEKLINPQAEQEVSEQPSDKPKSEQANTMSTVVSETPRTPLAPPNTDGINPAGKAMLNKVKRMLDFIDETSGSGQRVEEEGSVGKLRQKTLSEKTIIGHQIGEGRFGKVYVGLYDNTRVAIKTMSTTYETAFGLEVEILCHPHLRHDNTLHYYGATRKDTVFGFENWIITDYHEKGSLYQYLLENTIDLATFFRMARSVAEGLKFLHNETAAVDNPNPSASKWKPKMAHRDIKSRNILVKDNMSCCIADFGLALIAPKQGNTIPDDVVKNFKCGTVRYLAPEILNETIASNVFESYIMSDVYSFSLVMWEMLARTSHEDIVAREPDDAVPYIEWTDRCPKEEAMKEVVVKQQYRPTDGELWHKNEDFLKVMEIMSVCWNTNPGARYSSAIACDRLEGVHNEYQERIDPSLREKRLKEEEEVRRWRQNQAAEEERKLRRKPNSPGDEHPIYGRDAFEVNFNL